MSDPWENDPDFWKQKRCKKPEFGYVGFGIRPEVEVILQEEKSDDILISTRDELKQLNKVFEGMTALVSEDNEIFQYNKSRNLWLKIS